MMVGSIQFSGDATTSLQLRGPTGATLDVLSIIDTGFNDYLTLPLSTIEYLQLPPMEEVRYALADGSETVTRVFAAEVQWHDQWRQILVIAMDSPPLLGMALLRGSSLRIDVIPNGRVEIFPLPHPS